MIGRPQHRNFLIFYGVPVLIDILPKEQLAHLSLLSHSVHKLLKHSISKDCLEAVERMIFTFCEQFQEIYGKRHMFSNVHQLSHLWMDVRNLGPLWTQSCFLFEDKNRFILQLIHGSQKIEFQLNSAITIVQSILTVVEQTVSKDPLLMSFFEPMNRQKCVPVAQPFFTKGRICYLQWLFFFYYHLLAFCGTLFYKSIIEVLTLRISPERPRS